MANPRQLASLLHTLAGVVSQPLAGVSEQLFSPFYRESCDIPGYGELDLEYSGKQFRRGDVRLRLSACLVAAESVHTVAASRSNSRLKTVSCMLCIVVRPHCSTWSCERLRHGRF
jgi:hypothetical protein